MIASNILLLLSESVVYFGVMAILLHGRNRYGLGIFVCALGVTYLAAYRRAPRCYSAASS
jgi:hypothetical protein